MFGIGFSEMIVIGVILIVAVGPKRMPGMLRALVKAYHEFRRATRELRASTGIDELIHDEELRALRKPLHVPPAKKKAPPARPRSLSYVERMQESPPEGVDLAEVREAEARPSPEEADRIKRAKEAEAARDEAVVAAKIAAAEAKAPEEAEHARAKIAAKDAGPVRRAGGGE